MEDANLPWRRWFLHLGFPHISQLKRRSNLYPTLYLIKCNRQHGSFFHFFIARVMLWGFTCLSLWVRLPCLKSLPFLFHITAKHTSLTAPLLPSTNHRGSLFPLGYFNVLTDLAPTNFPLSCALRPSKASFL